MINQQLYRVDANGGRTIAVSDALIGSAWLNLLEQQLSLIDFTALSAPVYYQYPLGRGVVMSRCCVNPYTPERSFIAHQLILEDSSDIDKLLSARPMKGDLLPAGIFGYTDSPDPLPALSADALCSPDEAARCRETLTSYFGDNEALLRQFFGAVSLCARDKRHSVRVLLDGAPEKVTEEARQIMEITLGVIPREDVMRLSFCSLSAPASSAMQYTVRFAPKAAKPAFADPFEILVDPSSGTIDLPSDVSLPDSERFSRPAHALLTAGEAGSAQPVRASRSAVRTNLPPFRKGMSIRQYFADWRSGLDKQKASLSEEAFRALASSQWPVLITAVIAASDLMDNAAFLAELNSIISQIRREKLETTLAMSDSTLTDLLIILLDSISWRQIDLANPQTAKMIRTICAYSQVMTEDQCPPECLCACRAVYSVLASPASIHDALADLSRLSETAREQFEALQVCLQQYVEKRLSSNLDVIDESLTAAAMLGFVRFTDGIPDLRLTDKLTERIESTLGAKAARRFDQLLDKLRAHLHSTHGHVMRRRDMKLFLFISLLLLILIAAITVGFLLIY